MKIILRNNNLEVFNNDLTLVIKNATTVQLEFNYSLLKNDKPLLRGVCKSNGVFGNLEPLTINDEHVTNLDNLSQMIKELKPMFNIVAKSNVFQDRYLLALSA